MISDKDKDKRKKRKDKKKHSSDSSDLEQLLEIQKKYRNRLRAQEEIPIKKKDAPPPPQPPQPAKQTKQISLQQVFPQSHTGAYKIPLHLHKNYPHAIRLQVLNIPEPFDKDNFQVYLRKQMEVVGGTLDFGDPITSVQLVSGQPGCIVYFRSIEETDTAIQLDGLLYQGKGIRFRRVKEYETAMKVEGERVIPRINTSKIQLFKVSSIVSDGPLKLYITGFEQDISDDNMSKILVEFGNLKSLYIVREKERNLAKYAFCEFETEAETQNCIAGLNNKVLGGRLYQVRKGAGIPSETNPLSYQVDTINVNEQNQLEIKLAQVERMKASSVIKIINAIRSESIEEDKEFQFVTKDIKREIEKIGRLLNIVVPRKKDGFYEGIGNIYIEFENEQYAKIAYILLQGKQYDGRQIETTFYDPRLYADKIY